MNWYFNDRELKTDRAQYAVIDEETGKDIALVRNREHVPLIASAPKFLEALRDIHDLALKVINGAFVGAGAAESELTQEQVLDEIVVMAQRAITDAGEEI